MRSELERCTQALYLASQRIYGQGSCMLQARQVVTQPILSWNVHNWHDGNGKHNMSRVIQSLHQTPVDCPGLEEVLQWGKLGVGQNKQDIDEM